MNNDNKKILASIDAIVCYIIYQEMKQDTATSSDEKIDKIAEWLFEDWKKTLNEILLFEFEGREYLHKVFSTRLQYKFDELPIGSKEYWKKQAVKIIDLYKEKKK